MGVSENQGYLFWDPYNQDPTIQGTILGSPNFQKLPNLTSESLMGTCVQASRKSAGSAGARASRSSEAGIKGGRASRVQGLGFLGSWFRAYRVVFQTLISFVEFKVWAIRAGKAKRFRAGVADFKLWLLGRKSVKMAQREELRSFQLLTYILMASDTWTVDFHPTSLISYPRINSLKRRIYTLIRHT